MDYDDILRSFTLFLNHWRRTVIEDYPKGSIKIWLRWNRVVAAQAIGHSVSEIMQKFTNMIAVKAGNEEVARSFTPTPHTRRSSAPCSITLSAKRLIS